MADNQRVYPADQQDHQSRTSSRDSMESNGDIKRPPPPPPGGTYVIQYPKQQTYGAAPPVPMRPIRRNYFSPPPRRRNRCCRCFGWCFCVLLLLIVLLAAAVAVLYLIYRPEKPDYSIAGVSVTRFAFAKDGSLAAQLQVNVTARNPNKKMGIYYEEGNRLAVSYSGTELCSGNFPAFYQGYQNTTFIRPVLTGSGVRFSQGQRSSLKAQQGRGRIPLGVAVDVPVKIKIVGVKSPKFDVRLRCSLMVDRLSPNQKARVISKTCDVKAKLKIWKFTIG